MDIKASLLADILKAHEKLNEIKFTVNKNQYTFYFKYMTILEHTRINNMCIKETTYLDEKGNKEVRKEKQDYLFPIYTILEKALDKDGKRLFSLTNKNDFDTISKLDIRILSLVAAEMALDITGNLEELNG
jgi:polyphosphate kinase